MSRPRRGLTLIELVIVLVIIAILVAIALPRFTNTSGKAHTAAMRADLRNLARAQEEYTADKGGYTSDLTQLNFRLSPGVRLVGPVVGTQSGWSATVEHPQVSPHKCSVYVSTAAPVAPASSEGVENCEI